MTWFPPVSPELEARIDFEYSMTRAPLQPDDWQEFKRKFVSEYNGEKVQADGLTHSEFLRYLKENYREGDEYCMSKKLKWLIKQVNAGRL